MNQRIIIAIAIVAILTVQACSPAGGNKRGHEFMPDMVHSTAYEANIYEYYYYNTWGTEQEYMAFVEPRLPVNGTVPRGYTASRYQDDIPARLAVESKFEGRSGPDAIAFTPNGHVPYYYGDTEEERARATAEIHGNPYPITSKGLEEGKQLFTIYCAICHGEKGDGLGYLVRDANPAKGITAGVYPAAPANFMQDTFYHSSNGRFYHAIMYGRNVMGSHADKLSYEERWQVIHYIRSLQAKAQGLEYSEEKNTFGHGTPGKQVMAEMKHDMPDSDMEDGYGDSEENHGDSQQGESHNGDH